MGFLLFIVAFVLRLILFPVGFLFGLFTCWYRTNIWVGFRNVDAKFLVLAKSIDKHGNVVCGDLFNWTLIHRKDPKAHLFGNISETVSMVVGYNIKAGTLTKTGHWLNRQFNRLDEDHALEAIEKDAQK